MRFKSILTSVKKGLEAFGIDNFILCLFAVVGVAYLFPEWGIESSPVPVKQISNIGVSLIFFFYGLKLSPEKLKNGLKNIPLHFLVQGSTFLLFPLIVWIAKMMLQSAANDLIWMGIFFIAALPSTVSSSVVMVSIAKGNIPAAIFNASISSLVGVFMTPVIMGFFLSASDSGLDLTQVILDLFIQVIVPVALGIFLYPYFGKYVAKAGNSLKIFDQSIILLIVYRSFCSSFDQGLYEQIHSYTLITVGIAMFILFMVVYLSINKICRILKFSKEDTITAAFCGSKKSLVHGTVMSNVLFKGNSSVGVILLPMMIYHTLQLIACSILAQKLGKRDMNG